MRYKGFETEIADVEQIVGSMVLVLDAAERHIAERRCPERGECLGVAAIE
jgi:hypothetical protein